MKVAVISDLHIGDNEKTHQLGHTDDEFADFLIKLENQYDRIVLLGDIYETEMGLPFQTNIIDDAIKAHPKVCNRFVNDKYVYVYGNHDLSGRQHGGVERYELEYNDKKYLFVHGHQFDSIYNEQGSKVNQKSIFALGNLCLRLNFRKVYKYFTEFDDNVVFERRAINYAHEAGYNYIVTGHTHRPKITKKKKATFLNSGTCCNGRFCYIHMDLHLEEFEIRLGATLCHLDV